MTTRYRASQPTHQRTERSNIQDPKFRHAHRGHIPSSLDFDAADGVIALESPDAADLDSEDEDEELGMDMDTMGREILLPPELELPPGCMGQRMGGGGELLLARAACRTGRCR